MEPQICNEFVNYFYSKRKEISIRISDMRSHHYLHSNLCAHLCCYFHAVVPSGFLQVSVVRINLQGIPLPISRDISSCTYLVLLSYCSRSFHWISVCTTKSGNWTPNNYAIHSRNSTLMAIVPREIKFIAKKECSEKYFYSFSIIYLIPIIICNCLNTEKC